jgi:hypothetical protein
MLRMHPMMGFVVLLLSLGPVSGQEPILTEGVVDHRKLPDVNRQNPASSG